ncbi:MAG: glycosyl hydrolase-related protein [Planctomycetota bacterium]
MITASRLPILIAAWAALLAFGDVQPTASSQVRADDARATPRNWTIYLAQDKHLDYNWCGSPTEVELRMVELLDYYLDLTEKQNARWNLDGTMWVDVYRRHRGEEGAARLLKAIGEGRIGCAGNRSVLLWGILSTETAIRACYGAAEIEHGADMPMQTALVMENSGLTGGAATVLTECGFRYLGRGIYTLRAESYNHHREPYPLFWWQAPSGKQVLVRWDLYDDTGSWGGYAEAYKLAALAGEKWDARQVRVLPDRNTTEVFAKRKEFIAATVRRYESYGENYPISSILLLGTGWDNWTCTPDFSEFVRKYNAESDGHIRLIDARYEDFFHAAEAEIREKKLHLPIVKGSFGIIWEEWAAHLAGATKDFREAERALRLAEASFALKAIAGKPDARAQEGIDEGYRALLDFAEHDFGGIDWRTAALSAGVRAEAATRALTIARTLSPNLDRPAAADASVPSPEVTEFAWRGGRVFFDPEVCGVRSLVDSHGREMVPQGSGPSLGEFLHTRYEDVKRPKEVFPKALPGPSERSLRVVACTRSGEGVAITTEGISSGFGLRSRWLFHEAEPWIDIEYELMDGWTAAPQSVQFCFPLNLKQPTYRYDAPGAVLKAGPVTDGGDDLPGANPALWSAQTFASAADAECEVILLTPDAGLVQFGADSVHRAGINTTETSPAIVTMPMMNLTRNDRQFVQGGDRRWTFRYRLVFVQGKHDPLRWIREAQCFGTPPFLSVPGGKVAFPELSALDIRFEGGPVIAVKTSMDGQRLIVRLWNLLDRPAKGTLKLPASWERAEICDALERPSGKVLPATEGEVEFIAGSREILTLALTRPNK